MVPDGWMVIRDFMEVLSKDGLYYAIYRGQANTEWELVPSGFRKIWMGMNNAHLLRDWKWRAAGFATPMPQNDFEWLALAQHYGIATPLLDWTASPLVALFFSCADEANMGDDGCVWWANRRQDFTEAEDIGSIDLFAENGENPILVNAVGHNPRSTAQDSVLTLHTQSSARSINARRIFTVQASQKRETLHALAKLGFSNERLYADIGRLVDTFKREMAGRCIVLR